MSVFFINIMIDRFSYPDNIHRFDEIHFTEFHYSKVNLNPGYFKVHFPLKLVYMTGCFLVNLK